MSDSRGTTVARAASVSRYLVRCQVAGARVRDEEQRRRRGEKIEMLLREAGVEAHWIECKTSWLSADLLDVIEAVDTRAAQAAADVIALAQASIAQAA